MEISIQDLITAIKWFILVCGGLTVVIPAILVFAVQRWSDWKNEKWRLNTEIQLKNLENKFSEKASLLNNLLDVQKTSNSYSYERKVKSIEIVWNGLQELKNTISSNIIFMYNAVLDNEIEALNDENPSANNKFFKNELKKIDYNQFFNESNSFTKLLAFERPFLDYDLWLSVEIFNKFLGRLIYRTQVAVATNELKNWNKDKPTLALLRNYLTENEYAYVINQKVHSYSIIVDLFETKILKKINEELSGSIASNNSLEHIKKFKNIIDSIENLKPIN